MSRWFWPAAVAGWGVMAVGAVELAGSARVPPAALVRWVVGIALIHDLVVVPIVLLVAAVAVGRVPPPYRAIVQAALVVTAVAVAVAWPALRGYGRLATNPSVLPGNYATGLLTVLGVVWAAAAVLLLRAFLLAKSK